MPKKFPKLSIFKNLNDTINSDSESLIHFASRIMLKTYQSSQNIAIVSCSVI